MERAAVVALLVFVLAASPAAQPPQGRGQQPPADPRSAGGGNCANNPYNCVDTPNPLTPPDTVWMEDMTWMDVRDAVKGGKTTVTRSRSCSSISASPGKARPLTSFTTIRASRSTCS